MSNFNSEKIWTFTERLTRLIIQENFSDVWFSEELAIIYLKWNRRKAKIDQLPIWLIHDSSPDDSIGVSLVAAWQMLLLAGRCFDDAEDDEAPHEPQAINMGTGFLLLAQQVLFRLENLGISAYKIQKVITSYNQAVLVDCPS